MQKLLRNRIFLAVLFVTLGTLSAWHWYKFLSTTAVPMEDVGEELIPGVEPGPPQPPNPNTAHPTGTPGLLSLKLLPGEDVAKIATLFGLDQVRVEQLMTLKDRAGEKGEGFVFIPRAWLGEMRMPRDPFLFGDEESQEVVLVELPTDAGANPRKFANRPAPASLKVIVVGDRTGGGVLSLGEQVIRAGETYGDFTVVDVTDTGAVLRNRLTGEEQRLSFYRGGGTGDDTTSPSQDEEKEDETDAKD